MKTPRMLCGFLLLILTATVAGAAGLPPDARQALLRTQELMDEKHYERAAAHIRAYLQNAGSDAPAQAWMMLGGALYEAGDGDEAARAYCEGSRAHPESADLARNAGVVLYERKRYAESASYLETAYSLRQPPDPALLYQAGSVRYLAGQYADSARTLLRLLASVPVPRKEWMRLTVQALLESGQSAKTEALLKRYLDRRPEEADYWQLLARTYLDRRAYAAAGAALEICYSLRTPSTAELERLASLYDCRRAPLLAAAALMRAYGPSPGPDRAIRIAARLAEAGRTQQAVGYLERFTRNKGADLERGKILYRARRFAQAERVFEDLLAENDLPEARFYLALCAWERKDWRRARKELERVSTDKAFRARAESGLAVLYDLQRTGEEAE